MYMLVQISSNDAMWIAIIRWISGVCISTIIIWFIWEYFRRLPKIIYRRLLEVIKKHAYFIKVFSISFLTPMLAIAIYEAFKLYSLSIAITALVTLALWKGELTEHIGLVFPESANNEEKLDLIIIFVYTLTVTIVISAEIIAVNNDIENTLILSTIGLVTLTFTLVSYYFLRANLKKKESESSSTE